MISAQTGLQENYNLSKDLVKSDKYAEVNKTIQERAQRQAEIDVNAAWNGFGKKPTLSKEFVKCFTDAGFDWAGTWSKPDGMHFQLKSI